MREKLIQLLLEIGVPGVTGVPVREIPRKYYLSDGFANGTLPAERGTTSVPEPSETVHLGHRKKKDPYQEKPYKISIGTPVTLGTPVFAQDRTETYEERAAIMEFDAELPWQDAEAMAFEDCMKLYEGEQH